MQRGFATDQTRGIMPFGRKFRNPSFRVAKALGSELGLRMPWMQFLRAVLIVNHLPITAELG